MFSKVHERLGTAGLVVAVVALVAALAGTALAAAGLNGTQKKEVKKIAKQYAGKPGAPGAQGPQGPVGPQGSAGTNGKNGADGINGANGTDGQPGAKGDPGSGVIAEEVPKGPSEPCGEAGGYSFEVEGSGEVHYVCNGAGGSGPVKSGEEEKGVWSFDASAPFAHNTEAYSSIQFPRVLPESPRLTVLKENVPTTECPGSYEFPEAHPETTKPALCVYANPGSEFPESFPIFVLKTTYGLVQLWGLAAETEAHVWGTWAAKVP